MARMQPPPSGVTIRMYRQRGLGDCFLLAFRGSDEDARYLLIDCGVFFATSGGSARMAKIAADIEDATGGHIHVLVASHEHYDHLSGFGFSASSQTFERIEVDRVWLAWTEDPAHPLAGKLREEREIALRALRLATSRLRAADPERADRLDRVLGFFGSELGATSTASQLEFVKTQWGAPRFLRPGQAPLEIPGVDDIRVYVLGPPENEGLLKRSDPSTTDSEVYEEGVELNADTSFYAAALALSGDETGTGKPGLVDRAMPFDPGFRIGFDGQAPPGEHEAFFREQYGWRDREGHGPAWRRIGADWLRAAEELALQLDNHVNNTSLALAISLGPGGDVVLLPADAQVGNWLSWHDLVWDDVCGETVTGRDLLERAVFYKVGHHGSHNATLRALGLELMDSPELVAMIPVDEEQAGEKEWKMPFEPLYERLDQKTRGRIIRADDGPPTERPAALTPDEWDEFRSRVDEDEGESALWVQYTVPA